MKARMRRLLARAMEQESRILPAEQITNEMIANEKRRRESEFKAREAIKWFTERSNAFTDSYPRPEAIPFNFLPPYAPIPPDEKGGRYRLHFHHRTEPMTKPEQDMNGIRGISSTIHRPTSPKAEQKPKPLRLMLNEAKNGGWSMDDYTSTSIHATSPETLASFTNAADMLEGLAFILGMNAAPPPEQASDADIEDMWRYGEQRQATNGSTITFGSSSRRGVDVNHTPIGNGISAGAAGTRQAEATAPDAAMTEAEGYRRRITELLGALAGGDPMSIAVAAEAAARSLNN